MVLTMKTSLTPNHKSSRISYVFQKVINGSIRPVFATNSDNILGKLAHDSYSKSHVKRSQNVCYRRALNQP